MKRSSWIAVGLLAALIGVWLIKDRRGGPTAPAPLSIDGYVGNVSDADLRAQTKDKLPPVQTLSVQRKDGALVLEQQAQNLPVDATPDKAKPVEAKWSVKRTLKGSTSEAKAQPYRANAMAEVFGRSIRSTFSKEVKAGELADYGLDADQAIDVEAKWAGHTAKLRIGKLDKGTEGAEPTTWVQDPARPAVVYQVAGRDLRSPFDVAWSDLRDRALLTLDLAAIDRLEVANPADPRAPHFAIARPAQVGNAAREAGEGWAIVEPKGYAVGDAADWLRSLERLSASEFLTPAEVAAAKADTGLDDPKVAAKVTYAAGATKTVLVFGKTDEASPGKDVWMRIDGRDEIYKVASYTRDQVLTKFDQVRLRSLLGAAKAKGATSLKISGPDGEARLVKASTNWQFEGDDSANGAAVEAFLGDLDGMQVDFAADVTTGAAELETPQWRVQFTAPGGANVVVVLGKERDKQVLGWTEVAGVKGDVYRLQDWNASKLRKKRADFEDRRLITLAPDQIVQVESTPSSGVGFTATRKGGEWQLTSGDKVDTTKSKSVAAWIAALGATERSSAAAKRAEDIGLDKNFASLRIRGQDGSVTVLGISAQKSGEEMYVSVTRPGKAAQIVLVSAAVAGVLSKTAAELAAPAAAE